MVGGTAAKVPSGFRRGTWNKGPCFNEINVLTGYYVGFPHWLEGGLVGTGNDVTFTYFWANNKNLNSN